MQIASTILELSAIQQLRVPPGARNRGWALCASRNGKLCRRSAVPPPPTTHRSAPRHGGGAAHGSPLGPHQRWEKALGDTACKVGIARKPGSAGPSPLLRSTKAHFAALAAHAVLREFLRGTETGPKGMLIAPLRGKTRLPIEMRERPFASTRTLLRTGAHVGGLSGQTAPPRFP